MSDDGLNEDTGSPFGRIVDSPSIMSRTSEVTAAQTMEERVSDQEKVDAIVKEYGDIASLMQPPEDGSEPEPERLLAESKGSLFK